MRVVLIGLLMVMGLLSAGLVRAEGETDASMEAELSAMVEADADLRQAQGEAHIVFAPAPTDADSEEGADEDEAGAEDAADSDAEAESEESESESESESEEGSDEVEDGTLLLSEAEQTAFAEVVLAAVDDASDAASDSAEGAADAESLTEAETAAATMRFASARSQLAVRAQREFDAVAKAAIAVAKHASKIGDSDAESLSLSVAKHMGDGLLKTVGTGLAHKLGAGLAEKIGAWQQQLKQLSAAQSEAETDAGSKRSKKKSPADSMRFASAKGKAKGQAKGKDPRWFPSPLHVSATDSMRNEPMDITAVAPPFRSDKTPEDVEDCVACRYVWLQVEQDVGNSAIEETVYDSFFQNALEAQKTPIFYPGCQTMFDQVDDMLGDYMDGYSVDQMCENAMLCR